MKLAGFILALLMVTCANGATRSAAQRHAFQRTHPCPSTGERRGACPGYVIDHIVPLCAGGPDRPDNMQWQDSAAARAKDRDERRLCRDLKR